MEATVQNIYNNTALPGSGFSAGYGESFCISIGEKKLLLDTGMFPRKLLHNMKAAGIDPDQVDTVVLSHGHRDHTGGLPRLIKSRKTEMPLRIVAHPAAFEKKSVRMFGFKIPMGIPPSLNKFKQRFIIETDTAPVEIAPSLFTTGEISERPEKDGTEDSILHEESGKSSRDPILDDISLVLKTAEGLVLITGCCHAGLLNTLSLVSAQHKGRIVSIIGGTHMVAYDNEEIDHIGDVLRDRYGSPDLLLNHCTGSKAIEQLRSRFGSERVRDFYAGSSISFTLQQGDDHDN